MECEKGGYTYENIFPEKQAYFSKSLDLGFFKVYYFMCMGALLACTSVHPMSAQRGGQKLLLDSPGTRITDGYDPQCGH